MAHPGGIGRAPGFKRVHSVDCGDFTQSALPDLVSQFGLLANDWFSDIGWGVVTVILFIAIAHPHVHVVGVENFPSRSDIVI